MAIKPISVTQLNDYINRLLVTDPLLSNVIVKGEVSGVNYHSSGHVYLTIVDENSKIKGFINKEYVKNLRFKIDNGMEVTVIGGVNIYKPFGTYSLNIKNLEVAGDGNLAIAFERLKEQLNKEGLFDLEHKKHIPKFPCKVGVVTSKTGAAVKDILKIIQSKNNYVDVIVFPVLVQGSSAAGDIANMIDYINTNYHDIDTLIVGRGGGSAEELWAFNEEILARSVYNSRIPIISGVGHEIDFTICDLVADLRAETPTAAANIAVPDIEELKDNIDGLRQHLFTQLSNKFMYNRLKIDNLLKDMQGNISNEIVINRNLIEKFKLMLDENNPTKILNNGYSIVEDKQGGVITDPRNINGNDKYKITFSKGSAIYKLIEIGCEDNEKK